MLRIIVMLSVLIAMPAAAHAAFLDHIVVNLAATGLGYDSLTQKLYANRTVGAANTLTAITPTTGVIGSSYTLAGSAGAVQAGPRGGMLYTVNTSNIVPFNTATLTGGTPITVAANREILGMAVAPDNAARFAMTTREPGTANYGGIYLYQNGVQTAAQPTYIGSSLTFGATGSRLYSFDALTTGNAFSRYDVTASSLTAISTQATSIIGNDALTYNAGRIAAVSGEILNAEAGTTLGHVDPSNMGLGTSSNILFDAANNLGFGLYYNGVFARKELHAYAINNDANSFTWSLAGAVNFPAFTGVDNLTLAGPNRLAATVGNQIWVFDITPVPEPAGLLGLGVLGVVGVLRRPFVKHNSRSN